MNNSNKLKTITAVILLSFGLAGASLADHPHGRDDRGAKHFQRDKSEKYDRDWERKWNRGYHSERRHDRNGYYISIYERGQYGPQRRGDEQLRRMSRYDRQAVWFFRNNPHSTRYVWFDYQNRRHVHRRVDYPGWLLRR